MSIVINQSFFNLRLKFYRVNKVEDNSERRGSDIWENDDNRIVVGRLFQKDVSQKGARGRQHESVTDELSVVAPEDDVVKMTFVATKSGNWHQVAGNTFSSLMFNHI